MRATGGVQAGIGNDEPLDRLAAKDVGFDDLVDIGSGDPAVPDGVGIDHDVRAVLALVEAPRLVRADFVLKTQGGKLLLEGQLQLGLAGRVAAAAGMAFRTLIAANEDVSLELRHISNLQHPGWMRRAAAGNDGAG